MEVLQLLGREADVSDSDSQKGTSRGRFRGRSQPPGVRRTNLSSISNVLNKVMSKYGLDKRLRTEALLSCWPQAVGEPFSSLTRPLYIDFEGNIVIAVKDSAVGQELSFRKNELIRNLRPLAKGLGIQLTGMRFDLKHFVEPATERDLSIQASAEMIRDPAHEIIDAMSLTDEEEAQVQALIADFQAVPTYDGEISTDESADESLVILPAEQDNKSEPLRDRMRRMYERELKVRRWRKEQNCPECTSCGSVELRLHGEQGLCRVCFSQLGRRY